MTGTPPAVGRYRLFLPRCRARPVVRRFSRTNLVGCSRYECVHDYMRSQLVRAFESNMIRLMLTIKECPCTDDCILQIFQEKQAMKPRVYHRLRGAPLWIV